MWNSTQWRVGMQRALRHGSISHSGTSGAIVGSGTFTVYESAICSSVKESNQGQYFLLLTRHRWNNIETAEKTCSHLWVYLDWLCYSYWMTVAVKCGDPTEKSWHWTTRPDDWWEVTCGHLWFFYFCAVSCGGRGIQRSAKHLARPEIVELQKETFAIINH